jgi:NADPH:quinone reductase
MIRGPKACEETVMHGWFCDRLEGVESLTWREAPTPVPGPGEVLIAVKAASLNFPDLLTVQGKYQFKPPMPFVPGSEFSGHVEAVGDGVTHLVPGQAVAAVAGVGGGFGTHAIAQAAQVLPLPQGFALEHGAAFTFCYGTSHHALVDRGQLEAGETVLVLGAAGGTGSAAVQIAKAMGATVIAATSSDEKCAWCREIGADATLNYSTQDLRETLKALTGGKGPDVIYDPVGDRYAEPAFRSIAWRGRYLVVGFAGGGIPALPWNLALLKGASIVGVFWGDFVKREPQASAAALGQLAQWYAEGKVRPVLDATLPMADIREAYARMASRRVMGKLVLVNP